MVAVWLDVTHCTGCGACVEVCATGALMLVEGKAYLDDALCRGCEACIPTCPAGALQPVLEIEAVPIAPRMPEYAVQPAPASPRISSLATVVAVGTQLAVQAAPIVLNALGQWLTRRQRLALPRRSNPAQSVISAVAGRQTLYRWRGR